MRRALLVASIACASVASFAFALADKLDPRKPVDFVVGLPKGPSPTPRVDVKRRAQALEPLPRALRFDWTHQTSSNVDHAPLVGAGGEIIVVSARGEVTWTDTRGSEVARAPLGLSGSGPPTLLSDGTVVVVSQGGEAVGASKAGLRFRTRLGGERGTSVAPLPLDDGGVVVASQKSVDAGALATELDALDSTGAVRARATLYDTLLGGALIALGGRVIAVAAAGNVYAWTPGREPARVGSFGGVVDGGASAENDRTLVAVVDNARIVALDIDRGVAVPRTAPVLGFYLGPLAVRGNVVYGVLETTQQTYVIGVDDTGTEVLRAAITQASLSLGDGGALSIPEHVGVLVDNTGSVAWATADGNVGIVDPAGVVTPAPSAPCVRLRSFRGGASVRGLAPDGAGALVVACESGALTRYGGGG